jgi:hypothetical protein
MEFAIARQTTYYSALNILISIAGIKSIWKFLRNSLFRDIACNEFRFEFESGRVSSYFLILSKNGFCIDLSNFTNQKL